MKNIIFALFTLLAISCTKESQIEPCTSTVQVICFHTKINNWQVCPDPVTGKPYIVSASGPTTLDTMSVCDTAQWLIDTRAYDNWYKTAGEPKDFWLKEGAPNSCGCN